MKFNWGHGLTLVIMLGVAGLALLVYLSTKQKIDLVVEEYYPKELKYEEEIQKLSNAKQLREQVELSAKDSVYIRFPEYFQRNEMVSGNIWFYRPSDNRKDLNYDILLNDSLYMAFPLSRFSKGKYEVIIDWKYQDKSYLSKEVIIF